MPASVLVGYATRTGSTQEVAEAIADQMRKNGHEVDTLPLRKVRSLAGYRMLVLGAPLYMFRWHRDAKAFLSLHRAALEKLPVAVFALGPFHDVETEWQKVRPQLDKELAEFPWLAPISHEVFGGKFDPAKLRFPLNLIPALKKMPASDIRDWDAIREWAGALAKRLS